MNIFVLDTIPRKCARYHCNKHVVKMIVEYAQLLSTAHHLRPNKHYEEIKDIIYKKTHPNHPCALWVIAETNHYQWLHTLLLELCNEYTRRYKKIHATVRLLKVLEELPNIPKSAEDSIEFVQCMPEEYKDPNIVLAYRQYYMGDKRHIAIWSKSPIPTWYH